MKISKVIVVEGKQDYSKIQNYIKADIIITNGYYIGRKKINLLKLANQKRGLIVVTDNDEGGLKIRKIINEKVGSVEHIYIPKNCTKKQLEQLDGQTIKIMFKGIQTKEEENNILNIINKLKLSSKNKRNQIFDFFNINRGNNKRLIKILNILELDEKELKEIINNGSICK